MPEPSDLTPTSFSLLALISIRPWSAYELTRYMRGSTLRAIWPRAASHIYAEVKRLERNGLATCTIARQGNRKRSIYSITPQGEEALGEWIVEPSRRFTYESEAMLKVKFADHGELDDLRATIASIRDEALEDLALMEAAFDSIVNGDPTIVLPERRAYTALISRFTIEMAEARLSWVEYASKYLADWNEVTSDGEKEARGTDSYAESLEYVRDLLRRWQS